MPSLVDRLKDKYKKAKNRAMVERYKARSGGDMGSRAVKRAKSSILSGVTAAKGALKGLKDKAEGAYAKQVESKSMPKARYGGMPEKYSPPAKKTIPAMKPARGARSSYASDKIEKDKRRKKRNSMMVR